MHHFLKTVSWMISLGVGKTGLKVNGISGLLPAGKQH